MKKLLSTILSLTIIFLLSSTAFASDIEKITQTTYLNEYDYIVAIQNLSDNELTEIGMTKEDVDATVAEFEKALSERAALPVETLVGYGYTPEEIDILKNNVSTTFSLDDTTVPASQLRAAAGTCTGEIISTYFSATRVNFKYSWSWDHAPIVKMDDSAAVRWVAYDESGYEIDVTNTSDVTKISYYYGDTYKFDRVGTKEPDLAFNAINVQFPVMELFYTGTPQDPFQAYAKTGYIFAVLELDDGVENEIFYVKVAGLYGHTLIGLSAPSIGYSPPYGITISFSGGTDVDSVAPYKAKISRGTSTYQPTVEEI